MPLFDTSNNEEVEIDTNTNMNLSNNNTKPPIFGTNILLNEYH